MRKSMSEEVNEIVRRRMAPGIMNEVFRASPFFTYLKKERTSRVYHLFNDARRWGYASPYKLN